MHHLIFHLDLESVQNYPHLRIYDYVVALKQQQRYNMRFNYESKHVKFRCQGTCGTKWDRSAFEEDCIISYVYVIRGIALP